MGRKKHISSPERHLVRWYLYIEAKHVTACTTAYCPANRLPQEQTCDMDDLIPPREAGARAEVRLVAANVEDAVDVLTGGVDLDTHHGYEDYMATIAWVEEEDELAARPFSLEWCCNVIGADANSMRTRLQTFYRVKTRRPSDAFIMPLNTTGGLACVYKGKPQRVQPYRPGERERKVSFIARVA